MLLRTVAAFLVALIVTGCAGSPDAAEAPRGSAEEPQRFTEAIGADDGVDAVLTVDDLDVLGFGKFEVDSDSASLYRNPDPRGACGGRVPDFPGVDTARVTSFTSDQALVVLVDSSPEAGVAAAYIDALRADQIPGCAPHTSQTHIEGIVQTVTFEGSAEPQGVGDDALIQHATTSVLDQQPTLGSVIVVRLGDQLRLVSTMSFEPTDEAAATEIARLLAER